MKAYDLKQANSKLTSLNNATAPEALQELFANLVYHALVHGNASRERLAALRDNAGAPAKFKAGLLKHMPVKWDRAAKQYNFDVAKADALRLELGITYGESSFEDVADALPYLFEKQPRQPKDFVLADYLAQVAKKLDANGIANADAVIAVASAMLNNPAATKAAVQAVYKATMGDTLADVESLQSVVSADDYAALAASVESNVA